MKKVVVLSGAGISAESGIKTFRDSNGLWEGHDVMQVASPQGWEADAALVLDFYNKRRAQLPTVQPNAAHQAITALQEVFDVQVITQNVDDLHERAGNKNVLHLHGELCKVRSTRNPGLVYEWRKDLHIGDTCEEGSQLRPHIVWFGEEVPALPVAASLASQADVFVVVGTSMQVYPAAGLVDYAPASAELYYIDPNPANLYHLPNLQVIEEKATLGLPQLVKNLLAQA